VLARSSPMLKPRSSRTFRPKMKLSVTLLLTALLTGCVTLAGTVIESHCLIDRPLMVGSDDMLSDQTAREIEVHNELWARVCE